MILQLFALGFLHGQTGALPPRQVANPSSALSDRGVLLAKMPGNSDAPQPMNGPPAFANEAIDLDKLKDVDGAKPVDAAKPPAMTPAPPIMAPVMTAPPPKSP